MNISYTFEDDSKLDLSDFKGEWTYDNIENHFGEEIADRILKENPYYKLEKFLSGHSFG